MKITAETERLALDAVSVAEPLPMSRQLHHVTANRWARPRGEGMLATAATLVTLALASFVVEASLFHAFIA